MRKCISVVGYVAKTVKGKWLKSYELVNICTSEMHLQCSSLVSPFSIAQLFGLDLGLLCGF